MREVKNMGVICDKYKEQVIVIGKKVICGCGISEASEELLDYINER